MNQNIKYYDIKMNLVILSCTSQEDVSLNALTLIPYKNTITLITGMI